MADEQEIKIKVTTETAKAEKALDDVADKTDEVGESAEGAKSKWATFSSKLSAISPTFAKMSDGWGKASKEIDSSFGANTASAKLFKLGVVGALVAIAAKAAKVAWQFANETASMFDPQGYAQASGQMQASIKKLKTAIGSFTAPVVNAILKGISKITDGITWIVEKLRIAVAFIQGVVQPVVDAIAGAFWKVVDAIKAGINGIASFLGFGDVFETSEKAAESTTDAVTELTDATSAGLAGFDKLNTLNLDNAGDAEESEKIAEDIAQAKADGEGLADKIGSMFDNIDVGKVWDDFVQGCVNIKDEIVTKVMDWFSGAATWAGNLWGEFTKACGGIATTIVNTILGWFSGAAQWASGVWDKFVTGCSDIADSIITAVTDWFSKAAEWASGVWDEFVEWAGGVKDEIVTKVMDWFSGAAEWAGGLWQTFVDKVSDFKQKFKEKFEEIVDEIKSVFTGAWKAVKEAFAEYVYNPVATQINKLIDKYNSIPLLPDIGHIGLMDEGGDSDEGSGDSSGSSAPLADTSDIMSTIDTSGLGGLTGAVETVKESVGGAINGAVETIGKVADAVGSAVGKIGSKIKGFFGMASGGAVAPNNPQPYILGDNKRDYEIVSPVPLMEQAVMSAISKMNSTGAGGSSAPIEITITLDGRKIARQIFDPLQTEARRRGTSI